MKIERAISDLKYLIKKEDEDTYITNGAVCALKLAIDALDKQKPKFVVSYGLCPTCNSWNVAWEASFCINCGQALEWEGEDD